MRAALALVAGALLLAGSATASAQPMVGAGGIADVTMANGTVVGTASFMQEAGGVHLKAQFKGLPPGDHGIHVHAVGKCDGPDFMTAGGHFNPANHQHGLNNPQGAHAGDMVNLKVGADGTGTIDYVLKDVSVTGAAGDLFGPDGTALVIHAMPDDEMTDPSGNSGARIACGVINKAGTTAQAAPAVVASPSTLPRAGSAGLPIDASLPAALTGFGAIVAGLSLWR